MLSMWSNEIMKFLQANKSDAIFYFMDGPFSIRISVLSDYRLLLSCHSNNHEEFQISINRTQFISKIVKTVKEFLLTCDKIAPEFQNTYDYRQMQTLVIQYG